MYPRIIKCISFLLIQQIPNDTKEPLSEEHKLQFSELINVFTACY